MSPLVEDNNVKNFSRFLKFFLIEWSLAKWSKNKTWSKLEQWEQFLLKESQESLVTWKLLSNMNTQSYLNTQIILNDTNFFIGKDKVETCFWDAISDLWRMMAYLPEIPTPGNLFLSDLQIY